MRILFDLSHPAHYHLMKELANERASRGDKIAFAIKYKDVLFDLVEEIKNRYKVYEKSSREKKKGTFADLSWLLVNDMRMIGICRDFKPDIMLTTTFSAAHAGFFLGIPTLYLTEDDFPRIHKVIRIVEPFAKALVCPRSCLVGSFTKHTIQYSSYQELAYLHPDYFTPDPEVVRKLKQPYMIIRLAALNAHHDFGSRGMTDDFVRRLIKKHSENLTCYISAERKIPSDLEKYRFPLHPTQMHHALAFARIVIGDSATIMSESGILGTPAVYTGYFVGERGYLNDLENTFNLIHGIKNYDHELMDRKIDEVLSLPKEVYQQRARELLNKRYNPVPFFSWLIDDYPESISTLLRDPDYELKFMPKET